MKNYDYVVVGGGPAGIFFAYEMVQSHPEKKVLLIERGRRVEERNCPIEKCGQCMNCKPFCNITNGFSGAGAYSDGKLSLFNEYDEDFYVGGNLHKYVGVEETKKLISYTDSIYLSFGATTELQGVDYPSEISKIRKKAEEANLNLISIPIRHLGTNKAHQLYANIQKCLLDAGVDIMFETEVVDFIIEDNKVNGVYLAGGKLIEADKVVVAVGRVGANWLLTMCKKHGIETTPGIIDIGVRYELPDSYMKDINRYLYEGKLIGKPSPFYDKVRTFCQNPSGFVTAEVYDKGITLANGHATKDKRSDNTNLAILVSLSLKNMENPLDYARNIAHNLNALTGGKILVQRLGDVCMGKRTWDDELEKNSVRPTLTAARTGDMTLAIPYRVVMDLLGFIEMVDKVVPGFANDDNLLYAPEIKFYSNKVSISNSFETSVMGLYAIGDGCGLTRGLMMASASGVKLARTI